MRAPPRACVFSTRTLREPPNTVRAFTRATGRAAQGEREFQLWIERLVKDGLLNPGQIAPADLYTEQFVE